MSQVFTETAHNGEFIMSEANFQRSRENGVAAAGYVMPAGTPLGKITSGGQLKPVDNDAGDGSQTCVGILINSIDTSSTGQNAAVAVAYIARHAEVNGKCLQWAATEDAADIAANIVDLVALGIIVR